MKRKTLGWGEKCLLPYMWILKECMSVFISLRSCKVVWVFMFNMCKWASAHLVYLLRPGDCLLVRVSSSSSSGILSNEQWLKHDAGRQTDSQRDGRIEKMPLNVARVMRTFKSAKILTIAEHLKIEEVYLWHEWWCEGTITYILQAPPWEYISWGYETKVEDALRWGCDFK